MRRLAVEGEEGTEIELGLLEQLDLPDVDLFQRLTIIALLQSNCDPKHTF